MIESIVLYNQKKIEEAIILMEKCLAIRKITDEVKVVLLQNLGVAYAMKFNLFDFSDQTISNQDRQILLRKVMPYLESAYKLTSQVKNENMLINVRCKLAEMTCLSCMLDGENNCADKYFLPLIEFALKANYYYMCRIFMAYANFLFIEKILEHLICVNKHEEASKFCIRLLKYPKFGL